MSISINNTISPVYTETAGSDVVNKPASSSLLSRVAGLFGCRSRRHTNDVTETTVQEAPKPLTRPAARHFELVIPATYRNKKPVVPVEQIDQGYVSEAEATDEGYATEQIENYES